MRVDSEFIVVTLSSREWSSVPTCSTARHSIRRSAQMMASKAASWSGTAEQDQSPLIPSAEYCQASSRPQQALGRLT